MTTEQFKILCRAYFPDCDFYQEYDVLGCYIDDECRISLAVGFDSASGILGEYPDVKSIYGKPTDIIKRVYNDKKTIGTRFGKDIIKKEQ